jgi:hypothetical protein
MIVETAESHIVRTTEPKLSARLQGAKGHQVVGRKKGRRTMRQCEEAARSFLPALDGRVAIAN